MTSVPFTNDDRDSNKGSNMDMDNDMDSMGRCNNKDGVAGGMPY
jgi:hypothetical protein